jgi:hypothetical protein
MTDRKPYTQLEPLETVGGRRSISSRATRFWHDEKSWPYEAPGLTFLGRAMRTLGRARFPESWMDEDAFSMSTEPLGPYAPIRRLSETERALRLLGQQFADQIDTPHLTPEQRLAKTNITDEQWRTAQRRREQEIEAITLAREHFWQIAEEIREHCAYQRLTASIQYPDGSFEKVPPFLWNSRDRFQKRFETGKMSNAEVNGAAFHPLAQVVECWVFFGKDGVDTLATAVTGAPLTEPDKRPKAAEYRRWLRGQIQNSPSVRAFPKAHAMRVAEDEYNLSKRSADAIRNQVLDEFPPQVQDAWKKTGPLGS